MLKLVDVKLHAPCGSHEPLEMTASADQCAGTTRPSHAYSRSEEIMDLETDRLNADTRESDCLPVVIPSIGKTGRP